MTGESGRDPAGTRTLVLDPEMPFHAVHAAFVDDGWEGGPTDLTAPLVAGEPMSATWRRDGERAVYSCNPVVWLRVVTLPAGARVPGLVELTADDVLTRLAAPTSTSAGLESVLLGVLAAGALRLTAAAPRLRRLAADRHAVLATAARRALTAVGAD